MKNLKILLAANQGCLKEFARVGAIVDFSSDSQKWCDFILPTQNP